MTSSADLCERLNELHEQTADSPLFNPVSQLSLELSRDLEAGTLTLADATNLVAELESDSLLSRARRLHRLLTPLSPGANLASLRKHLSAHTNFAGFAQAWAHPLFHIVFTAHPTFLLTPEQSDAVAASAGNGALNWLELRLEPHERGFAHASLRMHR